MRATTIARNYAEALLALAQKANALDSWEATFQALASAISGDPRLQNFLAAPQVSAGDKNAVLEKAFAPLLPRTMLRFVQKVVDNRRQLLIPEIAVEFSNLVDESEGRVHAQVTVARDASDGDRAMLARRLSERLGKTVVPHVQVNPAILGGVIVKVGDTVMDGSVGRKLNLLRGKLTAGVR